MRLGMANLLREGGDNSRGMTAAVVPSVRSATFGICLTGQHRCEIASRPLAGCATEDEIRTILRRFSVLAAAFLGSRQRASTVQRKSDRSSRGKPGRSRLGLRARVQFYGSHAARRMGTRKGDRCELRNIPSPGHAFGRAAAAIVIKCQLALERTPDGNLGSRKPIQ